MNRRDFFKKSFLGFAVAYVSGGVKILSSYASEAMKAIEGKLGYKNVSRFPNKNCLNCKSYREVEGQESGECVLVAMRNAMKSQLVLVDKAGHCNMWQKI